MEIIGEAKERKRRDGKVMGGFLLETERSIRDEEGSDGVGNVYKGQVLPPLVF